MNSSDNTGSNNLQLVLWTGNPSNAPRQSDSNVQNSPSEPNISNVEIDGSTETDSPAQTDQNDDNDSDMELEVERILDKRIYRKKVRIC